MGMHCQPSAILRACAVASLAVLMSSVSPTPVGLAQSAPPLTPWRGFIDHVSATYWGGVPQMGVEVAGHSISGDGRHVVMHSLSQDLVTDDFNWAQDIFLRDRQTGTMTRVSLARDGTDPDGFSELAAISTNGRHVVFASSATNLVAGDTNGATDIFVRDLDRVRTVRVSVATDGTQSDGVSYAPAISATGRFVAFVSQATTLAPGPMLYGPMQAYVHDRDADGNGTFDEAGGTATTLESVSASGAVADNFVHHVRISVDGRHLLFESTATNLDPAGNPNNSNHVYVRDRQTGTTALIDRAMTGDPSAWGTDYRSADMSDDGRFITYSTYSTDIVPGPANWNSQVLRYDRQAQTFQTSIVTALPDGTLGNGYTFDSSLSADGRYVAFRSTSNNLATPAQPENWAGVFVRDMTEGTFTRVDVLSSGEGFDYSFPYAPSISADGTAVAFMSPARNAVDGQYTSGSQHSFVATAFNVSATPASFPMAGGTGSIDVNTLPISGWNAVSLESWITLVDGGGFGAGPRTVTMSVDANSSGIVRHGRIKLGSTSIAIHQDGDGDTTPPVITPIVTGALSPSGWYTSDITVQWSVSDPDSEIINTGYGCVTSSFTSDFMYANPTCEATSHGGTTSVSVPLRRDTTPPSITINSPLPVYYQTGAVITPSFACNDASSYSGVASCERTGGSGPLDTTTAGWHPFTVTATDQAGNTTSKTVEYLIGTGACVTQAPALKAWWRFNGSLFDTVDRLYASPSHATGWFDPAVAGQGFTNGSWQNYLITGDESRLLMSSALTVAMWVKPIAFSGASGTLVTKPAQYRIARYPDGTLRWAFSRTTGYTWVNTGVVIPYQHWSHVALTYDNGLVNSYVNGKLVHTHALSGSPALTGDPNASFSIGGRADQLGTLSGTFDDVQVYDGAMSAAGVAALAQAGSGSLCVPNGSTLTLSAPSTIGYGATFRVTAVLRDEAGNPIPNRQVWLNSHVAPGGFAGGVSGTTDVAGEAHADLPVSAAAALGAYARAASAVFEADVVYRESSAQTAATLVAGTPVVTWPSPAAVVYGTALSAAQLNATANVQGSFSYSPAAGTVLNAGSHTLSVTFTPNDTSHWAPTTKTTGFIVSQAVSDLQWSPTQVSFVYGTALSAAQLNATANVPGTFVYSPSGGVVLGAGSHVLSVTFTPADAANYVGSSSTRTVSVAAAPLAIAANNTAKLFGAPLPAFSATPAGFVSGDSMASLNGALTFATSATPSSAVGTYPIVPQGVSSPNYAIAFVTGSLTVTRASTAVAVAVSPNPSGFNQPVTHTAAVSVIAPGSGAPQGTIQFFDGGTLVGTAPLVSGSASLTTNGLFAGSHTLTATYSGDASFAESSATTSLTVRPSSTSSTTTVTSTRNPSNVGQSVTFRATVTSPSGGVSGTVQFYDGSTLLGSAAISSGVAQFTTTSLAAGGHAIVARYLGNASLPPSVSTALAQTVGSQSKSSSTAIAISPSPSALGGEVTITATVTGGQQKAPTGNVLFLVNGQVLGQVPTTVTGNITANAVLKTSALPRGTHTVVAVYLADPTFRASARSAALTVN
jgi:Concanavalin A-like lectin/glucanases superfamily/Bacterial Ig-like domain (group 3)/MBG domain (YGX type)